MNPDNDNMNSKEKYYEIGATVISGLEYMAKEECEEKLKCKAEIDRGRIFFKVQGEQLRSVSLVIIIIHVSLCCDVGRPVSQYALQPKF